LLADGTSALAEYRKNQGLETMVVDLDAIYDEFNAGIAEPLAIRAFLRYAVANWAQAPRYATLVGRGTFDYKNVMGYGDNLVPTLLAASPDGLFSSDVVLADLTGDDGVPEIALGRIPVISSEALQDYIAKIQAHETAEPDVWQRRVLMAADQPDAGGNFTADSEGMASILPPERQIEKIYLASMPVATARQALITSINEGIGVFNYIGHGGFDRLATAGLLTSDDVALLHNAGRLPVVLGLTCVMGDSSTPGYPSLGETLLLKKDGGAYVVWGASGLSENQKAVMLGQGFFTAAFIEGDTRVGDATMRALAGLGAPNAGHIRRMYSLLGEPVSQIPR
jgi:hypothetical protein